MILKILINFNIKWLKGNLLIANLIYLYSCKKFMVYSVLHIHKLCSMLYSKIISVVKKTTRVDDKEGHMDYNKT